MTLQDFAAVSASIDRHLDWPTRPLRELCVSTSLIDPSSAPDREFEYVDVSSVSADRLRIVGTGKVKGRGAPSRARKVLKAGDVIFATVRPTLRRVALVPANLEGQLASTAFCVIRANRDLADPRFLYYAAITDDFVRRVGALERGASYPAVSDRNVMDQDIALPSLLEQRAIAEVLSKLQAHLELEDRVAARLKDLKAATMAKLFREGLRGEPLKQTEVGEIPESWEIAPLGQLVEIHDSRRVPLNEEQRRRRSGSFPYCGANGVVDYVDGYLFDGEYVLVAEDGGYWGPMQPTSYVMSGRFWVNNHAHVLKGLDGKALNRFLSPMLNYLNLDPLIGGDSRGKLTQSLLKRIAIPHPRMEEQVAMTEILGSIDRRLRVAESNYTNRKALFDVMLGQLTTGAVRLTRAANETGSDVGRP